MPAAYAGKTLIGVDLRKQHRLNVIAFRKMDEEDYAPYSSEYRLQIDDVLLVGGTEEDITLFTEEKISLTSKRISGLLCKFFSCRS